MSDNEQKNETRETIDDIVFELREHDHEMIPPYLCFDEEGRVMIGALVAYSEQDFARLRESGLRGEFLRVYERIKK